MREIRNKKNSAVKMSIDSLQADPRLERPNYHLLHFEQLSRIDDAESLFERGRRLRNGTGVMKDQNEAWNMIIASAKQGHPLGLLYCLDFEKGAKMNKEKSREILRASSARGHPVGTVHTQLIHCVKSSLYS